MLLAGVMTAALAVLLVTAAQAVPVEQTKYGRSALRLECRPDPLGMPAEITFERMEKAFAQGGVGARWISVVDPVGCPYYKSKFIPTNVNDTARREELLKQWVRTVHRQGLPVVSWFPLILCKCAHDAHAEWRQHYIIRGPEGKHRDIECCFNTGYGQALIDFCNEAIDKFGLDGIWFDGSAWTQIWDRPLPLSCVCPDCRRLFKEQTGLDLPEKVDWTDPTFRRWVAWRYDTFGSYIGRLAAGIRKKHPNAVVVINHYHRPVIPWQSAIPLNPYPADIISGSEANGEGNTDLTMRLCRAYGRNQSEVWRPFNCGTQSQIDELIHHALTCVTAGGLPSYGTSPDPEVVSKGAKQVSAVLDKVRPYVCSESVPYAALHLSQQTETFYFSRDPKGLDWNMEPFWRSVVGWTQGMMQGHIAPDYVYDKQFDLRNLSKYRVLLMPMSIALSDDQCRTVLQFVRDGGTVVLGPGAGSADEWGEKRQSNSLEETLGFRFGSIPSPAATETVDAKLLKPDGQSAGDIVTLYSPLSLSSPDWKILYNARLGDTTSPAVVIRSYGSGNVLVSGVDLGGATVGGWMPVMGGDTSMAVTDETAAQGEHSLKFTDGPNAPKSFYPDMEIRFRQFGPPERTAGRLSCDLRLEQGAEICIEGRESSPKLGPSIHLGRDGKLWAQDSPLCDLPVGQWFHVEILFRLSPKDRTYDVTVTLPGESPKRFTKLPYIAPDFGKCDWFVIYGEGTAPAAFYLDDLRIESLPAAPRAEVTTILAEDFEAIPPGKLTPKSQVADLAAELLRLSPAPVEVDAPDYIRVGTFRRNGSGIVVHLHNIEGTNRSTEGPQAILRLRVHVKSAHTVFSGGDLRIERKGQDSVVTVPSVPLHEAVVLKIQ